MPVMTELELRTLDLRKLDDSQANALNDFFNLMRAEVVPEDPPIPLSERLADWNNIPKRIGLVSFAYFDADRVAAYADIGFELEGTNTHLCWSGFEVQPKFRRSGLSTQLLEHVLRRAKRENRRVLILDTNERIPAGAHFAKKIGAKPGIENHTNRLLLEELNKDMLEQWIADAPIAEFELEFYTADYPEFDLEALCELFDVMNTAPRGELEINDDKTTPEKLLEWEQARKAQGVQRWTAVVRERSTGRYAGFTTTGWQPNRPHILGQWGTGVNPIYRGKGLGKWLKAAMLERVMHERPEVNQVRTGNADSNGPMLRINHALGFKPFIARTEWQLEVDAAFERLNLK
jgi:GNAT superfamily N-acetyltransferase